MVRRSALRPVNSSKARTAWKIAMPIPGSVRLYYRLFTTSDPDGTAARTGVDFTTLVNPASLEEVTGCMLEPMLGAAPAGARFQFELLGYFCVDTDSTLATPIFNRTVSLKDTWAKVSKNLG